MRSIFDYSVPDALAQVGSYGKENIMEKSCNGCKWKGWMPDDSREPWGPCDMCDDYDNYEFGRSIYEENDDEVSLIT